MNPGFAALAQLAMLSAHRRRRNSAIDARPFPPSESDFKNKTAVPPSTEPLTPAPNIIKPQRRSAADLKAFRKQRTKQRNVHAAKSC